MKTIEDLQAELAALQAELATKDSVLRSALRLAETHEQCAVTSLMAQLLRTVVGTTSEDDETIVSATRRFSDGIHIMARYISSPQPLVQLGPFQTIEEAERALHAHMVAKGLVSVHSARVNITPQGDVTDRLDEAISAAMGQKQETVH